MKDKQDYVLDLIDTQLFEMLGIHQDNISCFIDAADEWEELEKKTLIIAVCEYGYI